MWVKDNLTETLFQGCVGDHGTTSRQVSPPPDLLHQYNDTIGQLGDTQWVWADSDPSGWDVE